MSVSKRRSCAPRPAGVRSQYDGSTDAPIDIVEWAERRLRWERLLDRMRDDAAD